MAYVPLSPVKAMLRQAEPTSRWAKWLARIQEFDLGVQSTSLVQWQGICKLIAKSKLHRLSLLQDTTHDNWDEEIAVMDVPQPQQLRLDPFLENIKYYLLQGKCPKNLPSKTKRAMKLKAASYAMIHEQLYKRGYDGTLHRCLAILEAEHILEEFHAGTCGGHCAPTVTTHKILRDGYY